MIIKTDVIKQVSTNILSALDTSEHTVMTDTLEMVVSDNVINFNVTNKEYYVRISTPIDCDDSFRATVNAAMFLKLISTITTDTVELNVTDNVLEVTGNGKFNIPLMLSFNNLLELPELDIDTVTQQFTVSRDILQSIINYNSKEIAGNAFNDLMRKSYYIDDKGCLTFTIGACINSFTLPNPIKLILGDKIVKLFKLFNDSDVVFEMGFNQVGSVVQTRIRLHDSTTCVSAITYSSDGLISKFPVDAIRERAEKIYPFSTTLNRNELSQSLHRFEIFSNYDKNTTECKFTFSEDSLIIENNTGDTECIKLALPIDGTYKATLDLYALKNIVDANKDSTISINFGDEEAFLITKGNISNIITECHDDEE